MPELVGLAPQRKPVIGRHHLSIGPDGREDHEVRTGALRADLGHLRRTEAARKGELKLIGRLLVAKHQNGMLLEGRADRRIGGIVGGDVGKCDAAQFCAESPTQRHEFHRQVLPVFIARGYGKSAGAATIPGALDYRGLPADSPVKQAPRFETILNIETAKTLGLNMPASLLLRADNVISWRLRGHFDFRGVYSVDHAGVIYLLGRNGEHLGFMPPQTNPD